MNSDVEKSKYETIDAVSRNELGNLSVIFWQDQYFLENMEIETCFQSFGSFGYRDFYEGYTELWLPFYERWFGGDCLVHHRDTSKTSGTVKTPLYGEKFDANKFQYVTHILFGLRYPSNLANLTELNPGLKLVVQLYMDVALYPGHEVVKIYAVRVDKIVMGMSFFYHTGNVSVIKVIPAINIAANIAATGFPEMYVFIERRLEKALVEESLEKRNTGFILSWYYEDKDGNRVDIESERMYKEENNIRRFVAFINLFYEALTYHNVSLESLWDIAKRYRLDYIQKKVNDEVESCSMLYQSLIPEVDYFHYFSSSLKISFTLQDQPVYKDQITDDLLFDGFQLFHYIARCKDIQTDSINTFQDHINIFNKDSTITILEVANLINKVDTRQKLARSLWKQTYRGKLMDKMNEIFQLDIYKMAVLASPAYDLEDIRDEQIRKEIKSCLENGSCEELRAIVSDQGNKFLGSMLPQYTALCVCYVRLLHLCVKKILRILLSKVRG